MPDSTSIGTGTGKVKLDSPRRRIRMRPPWLSCPAQVAQTALGDGLFNPPGGIVPKGEPFGFIKSIYGREESLFANPEYRRQVLEVIRWSRRG
jgi:hypothetical protein